VGIGTLEDDAVGRQRVDGRRAAVRTDRYDVAIDAYKHVIELKPSDPNAYLGAAAAYLRLRKLDDARGQAALAAEVAPERDAHARASSHELLAKIALTRHDADEARSEAELARLADPTLPMPAYVEARLLADQGQHLDALPWYQQAIAGLKKPGARQIAELHVYTAETLIRLERGPEAEQEFLEELRYFPQHTRARAGLAMLYHATGRADLAADVVSDMIRITPTPDAYAIAARLWSTFGNPRQANAVRAEARRAFGDTPRAGGHPARH
jgi:tetratricopeptide (TPR) repeat protein